MGNKARGISIDKEKVHSALKENKITMEKASKYVGITYPAFKRSVNTLQKLQPDQLYKLAELTNKEVSYFSGQDSIFTLGSNNYSQRDVAELHNALERILWLTESGEAFKYMDLDQKDQYVTDFQSWMLLFARMQNGLTSEQFHQILDPIEAMVDGYISRNIE